MTTVYYKEIDGTRYYSMKKDGNMEVVDLIVTILCAAGLLALIALGNHYGLFSPL